jgi:hypothetical protein
MVNSFITVWVLIVAPGSYHSPSQLGPYYDLDSCERVHQSVPLQYHDQPAITAQCVQISIPASGDECTHESTPAIAPAIINSSTFPPPSK